jgi:ribosomal protein L11 methyltransferase
MKWIEIKVLYEPDENLMVDELIASVFEDADTGGVAVERPDMEPAEGWDPGPVNKPDHFAVKGFIPSDENAERTLSLIEVGLERLKSHGIVLSLHTRLFDEEDWSETWKEHFWPENITDKLVVKPTWREYTPKSGETVIEIDPGMAFGTGTHPTTRMCVELIEKYLKNDDSFLDIGAGSGILMIAARKLGSGPMTGTDLDLTAVETAEQNLLLNGIPADSFTLIHGNLAENVTESFKVVAANILAEVIVGLSRDLPDVVDMNGFFICSGILSEKAEMVSESLTANGFTIVETRFKDAWAAMVAIKGKAMWA